MQSLPVPLDDCHGGSGHLICQPLWQGTPYLYDVALPNLLRDVIFQFIHNYQSPLMIGLGSTSHVYARPGARNKDGGATT
jgi:hypothetical protein